MKIVIPSRKRSHTIGKDSLRLFPDATVCVEDTEVEDYLKVTPNVLAHPPLKSLGAIRQWILDHVEDEAVFQVDDDILHVMCLTSYNTYNITDPENVAQIVENACQVAKGIGARLFGFNQSADVKTYDSYNPFRLNGWMGTAIGFIGRDLRYDQRLSLRDDIDISLQSLAKHRITFVDMRFHFRSRVRFVNPGGNAVYRSEDREKEEMAYLKRKWGPYIHYGYRPEAKSGKVQTATSRVVVKRRWPLKEITD